MQQKKHGNAFAAGAAKWAEGNYLRESDFNPCVV